MCMIPTCDGQSLACVKISSCHEFNPVYSLSRSTENTKQVSALECITANLANWISRVGVNCSINTNKLLEFAFLSHNGESQVEIYTRTFLKIFSSKKIISTKQNAELTTGIHALLFSWIFMSTRNQPIPGPSQPRPQVREKAMRTRLDKMPLPCVWQSRIVCAFKYLVTNNPHEFAKDHLANCDHPLVTDD